MQLGHHDAGTLGKPGDGRSCLRATVTDAPQCLVRSYTTVRSAGGSAGTSAAFEAKMVTAKHVVVIVDSIAIEIIIIVVIVVWSS